MDGSGKQVKLANNCRCWDGSHEADGCTSVDGKAERGRLALDGSCTQLLGAVTQTSGMGNVG